MVKRICILTRYNPYETKRYFAGQYHQELLAYGIKSKIIDIDRHQNMADVINEIGSFSPDLICNFCNEIEISKGDFVWDHLNIPFWSVVYDPVWYHEKLLNNTKSVISCVDLLDCNYIQQLGFNNSCFWPHAVSEELSGNEEKSYDVVFIGSYYKPASIRSKWEQFGESVYRKVIEYAIDLCLSDTGSNPAGAVISSLKHHGVPLENTQLLKLIYLTDLYIRGTDRLNLIRSVKDHHVHIFGGAYLAEGMQNLGWAEELSKNQNVTIHPEVSFEEAINILKKSKICLNSMCKFKKGTHERVFYSLACGAVPITTDNLYLKEQFVDGEDLYYYKPKSLENVNEIISDLLNNPDKRQKIAISGRKKLLEKHTWKIRVEEMLEMFFGTR